VIQGATDVAVTVVKTVQVFLVAGVVLTILATIPGVPSLTDFTTALAGLGHVAQTAVRMILEAIPA
jgi:flagellar biosynthesis component FlhA